MFSSAFKTFTSNITSNYEVSKQPVATSGTWTIFDAKKRSTGAQASVFVFKRESLDVPSSNFGARASATSVRKIQDEVVERLRKEANSLARLRHPSVLQLVEPVEDTRSGGLMFATESVVSSLAGALAQKDRGQRSSTRYDSDNNEAKTMAEVELDELEVQKGLLQVAKGLEFLHDSAKLVHGNLTPEAIFINAKSDWKISGLSFAGPPDGAEGHQTIPQISLSEVLHHDSRLPRTVQLNLDYSSPDFVLDTNINFSADIYSLGLILLACYGSPHKSPIETHGNQSTYKKIFSTPSTTPSPSNNYLCAKSLPRELEQTLPRILARRPAQRMTAAEFQQSKYFDNILVNTVRFLDALPAKTPAEKIQFMRGLGKVMPQFPPSVLGKKVLSALLDEMKDKELLALVLQNIFKIIKAIPSGKDVLADKVLPRLREVFLAKSKSEERDTSKEAGLVVFLENIQLISENCTAKQFKDDVLPVVHVAMESSTHSLIDSALQCIPGILPVLDFTTVKHDLFPVVASVFSKTSSLSIKVRGLEALGVLCGASTNKLTRNDDLSGVTNHEKPKNVSSLDKFTMQEKVLPLLKGIKTKEPAVMMAALKVFQQIGLVADIDFLAMQMMPILWSFALGPLLDLNQFKQYMDSIKLFSERIEREQMKKLQELSSVNRPEARASAAPVGAKTNGIQQPLDGSNGVEDDFERLVLGNKREEKNDVFAGALSEGQKLTPNPPSFSWSSTTTSAASPNQQSQLANKALRPQPVSRSITPDVTMSAFPTLQPAGLSSATWASPPATRPAPPSQNQYVSGASNTALNNASSRPLQPSNYLSSNFALPPPPPSNTAWQSQPNLSSSSAFAPILPAPPSNVPTHEWQQTSGQGFSPMQPLQPSQPLQPRMPQASSNQQKSGLDKYQSLI